MATTSTNIDCPRTRRPRDASAAPRPRRPRAERLSRAVADYVADELAARRSGTWL